MTVSPAIGCLLSLFEAGSGLLEEERSALKSFSFANSSGSCARAEGPSAAERGGSQGGQTGPESHVDLRNAFPGGGNVRGFYSTEPGC